ncbi:DEAD/DEAH box helicase [Streptococcus cuniculipharyngis]|uniref:DEAD/DEAH box helicase n=1 Tax=Streptococcus cuniculipharyngis TaxID=1562651 RepID=A0A5C5SCS7_9STRE|nr:DEAD/DEAH box helicase [Streptococcus cuniculipharyngis]TWS98092.1 DEAD/DEAH box helicase [Streptococcus cuniculipharyngis]
MTDLKNYYGRLLTDQQLPDDLRPLARRLPSMVTKQGKSYCGRCSSRIEEEWCLPDQTYYCRACIVFGRVLSDLPLYHVPQKDFEQRQVLNWQGELTPYQAEVSQHLQEAIQKQEDILVHAVTGAGKTEMIYQPVASLLAAGKAVALVSPRIDVCVELFQRLTRDFTCPISLLHGGSEAYQGSPLVIATVHQLFKFYQAFDLIIIDEVDAFPFVDNAMLYQAVEQAIKPEGSKVFLTATSTDRLDRAVKSGQLKKVHLARRFHANPLVVPRLSWLDDLLESLSKQKIPTKLKRQIEKQQTTGHPLLIFFPHISLGQDFCQVLTSLFPDKAIGFVSSQTAERQAEVERFRQRDLDILISTTILERGVTFPCVDVFVLWSNHRLYNRSSLVQIAGRVGRSKERPTGLLIFFHDGKTKAMLQAIREIKQMNKEGGFE